MSITAIENETYTNLLNFLQVEDYTPSAEAETLLQTNARYIKDLKINVTNSLKNAQNLSQKEAYLIAYSVAVNEKFVPLKSAFSAAAVEAGATKEELAEVVSLTSLMNVNNIFYRFRHFAGKEFYNTQPAGIKMSIMMNPVIGKEAFELISLVISAVNGCELCVNSHESKLVNEGTPEIKILEAVKLGAVIKSLITVLAD
ncbi:carboxymuconolactone decarboxylase family protein [Arachidicoccus ginsenosidivorans]|jgi:alkyl hydroperoxide reductase subunit D|uniref:Alkyl hydroperoxide reductase AhpD n=1 Tax=Arachidicoccus ginsenosidivorans TaxID=496057 RepID=A0A5B8VHE7_9BACT|nr:carboxymuconolactone decarboxylase family protein [Arachidicoccus ginsenosidivorans]QEC71007.1 alkylhydroperoxidase [Arachidicoccus ginsenosidivorans]